MEIALVVVAALTAVVSVSILAIALAIAFRLSRAANAPRNEGYLPKAAVILSIRGGDPYLNRLLDALADLDYPDYQVHIVVDSEHDPEWGIVQAAVARYPGRFIATTLAAPAETCGLKNSALIQAVSRVDRSAEVVAFVDADAHIYRSWLRELAAPLRDPLVGASTGFRWYMPGDGQIGSLTRYYWNAAVLGVMWVLGIAWGGSMAVRRSCLDEGGLPALWKNTLSDDTLLGPAMRRLGLSLRAAPSVIVVNREQIRLRDFVTWGTRQTLMSRLHSPAWWLILLYVVLQAGLRIPALAIILVLAHLGNDLWTVFAAIEAFYWASMIIAAAAIEFSVRRILRPRSEPSAWLGPRTFFKMPIALVLAHVIALYQVFRATFMRTVRWRGIEYQIAGDSRIVMTGYRPFKETRGNTDESIL